MVKLVIGYGHLQKPQTLTVFLIDEQRSIRKVRKPIDFN